MKPHEVVTLMLILPASALAWWSDAPVVAQGAHMAVAVAAGLAGARVWSTTWGWIGAVLAGMSPVGELAGTSAWWIVLPLVLLAVTPGQGPWRAIRPIVAGLACTPLLLFDGWHAGWPSLAVAAVGLVVAMPLTAMLNRFQPTWATTDALARVTLGGTGLLLLAAGFVAPRLLERGDAQLGLALVGMGLLVGVQGLAIGVAVRARAGATASWVAFLGALGAAVVATVVWKSLPTKPLLALLLALAAPQIAAIGQLIRRLPLALALLIGGAVGFGVGMLLRGLA